MNDPTAPSGAGVLELLRRFNDDTALADRYAAACLEKAKAAEPVLKAFEYLPLDVTRRPGPLSGIPVAIKDIIATSDMPTTNGSPIYRNHIPEKDAWVVERLRNLGATIFGKTVSTEFAWRHPGPTTNPWNSKHTPGGSSSGSAAAVAAGVVPLALGTQTLGLVIRPAAFNGVVGLKPSFGAIPRAGVHHLAVATLRSAGATIEEREWSELDSDFGAINTILTSEAAHIFSDLVERYPDRTSDFLKSAVKAGKEHSGFAYLRAKSTQERLRAALPGEMSGFDAILTVPAFGEAPEGLGYTGDASYCAPWTLVGAPAVALPAGFGRRGLPLGIQVVGSYRQDLHLLRVAKWIEGALHFDPGIPKIAAA